MAQEPGDDLVLRFKSCLTGERVVCVSCVAAQLEVDPQVLADAVLLPLWTGYSFASTRCTDCGRESYCALSTDVDGASASGPGRQRP